MITFSNYLYCLAEHLAQIVFQNAKDPFGQRIIVVPSDRYKRMLQEYFATHPQFSVAMGLSILTLPQYFFHLLPGLKIPSSALLRMRLYAETVPYLEEYSQQQRKAICQQLGALFHRYGNCSEASLKKWLGKEGWQQKVWRTVFEQSSCCNSWSYFSKVCETVKKVDTVPYLFGFSSLPEPFALFFKKIEAKMFLFSPCRLFWSDLYRSEERLLLKSFGKWGMRFLNALSAEEMECEEDYQEPAISHTLGALQKSILDLEPIVLSEEMQKTVRVVSARSRRQEVEELYESLLRLLQKNKELKPSDILVLSPDLPSYVPFIHAAFNQLDYAISGLDRKSTSPLAQGVCLLFALIEEKWDLDAILALFSHPLFAAKRKWENSDLELTQQWLKKGKMTWGLDKVQFVLDRWLLGLCANDPKLGPKPCPVIGWPDAELFASVIQTIEDLRGDLCEETKKPLKEWLQDLLKWIDKYFDDAEESWLKDEIEQLIELCIGCEPPIYTWMHIREICEEIFSKKTEGYHKHLLEAVQFDGLGEGCIVPKKVIVLLGMQDSAFPRAERETSLDQMEPKLPSQAEMDRFLFLEALVKAQDLVLISYLHTCPEQGEKLSPSLLIEELKDHLGEFLPIEVLPEKSFDLKSEEEYFSHKRYAHAKAFSRKKTGKKFFAEEWKRVVPLPSTLTVQDCDVDIVDLKRLMKDPVEVFFKKNLAMPLDWKEESPFYEGDFFLKKYERQKLVEQALKTSLETALNERERESGFPHGIFGEVGKKRLQEEFDEVNKDPLNLRDIEIAPWKIAWDEKTTITLKGTIENVSEHGLVELFKESPAKLSIWKRWPEILVLRGHPDLQHIPCQVNLTYAKRNPCRSFAGLDAQKEIRALLYYYFLAKVRLSPIYPKWADDLFEADSEKLAKKIQQEDGRGRYVQWLIQRDGLPDYQALCKTWSEFLKTTFSALYEV